MLSSECEHEGTHHMYTCRVFARHLQVRVLHRLFHGQGLGMRERELSSEREGRSDGGSHVHRSGGHVNTMLGWA